MLLGIFILGVNWISDASDWSEPHASRFLSEDEMEVGFCVLVRCYGPRSKGNQDHGKDITGNNANVPELCFAGELFL